MHIFNLNGRMSGLLSMLQSTQLIRKEHGISKNATTVVVKSQNGFRMPSVKRQPLMMTCVTGAL